MRVITETELREQYKQEEFTTFRLPDGVGLTPAARQFLTDRRIEVVNDGRGGGVAPRDKAKTSYTVHATGEKLAEKPEYMTHLRGTALVLKNHTRIRFRGKLDSFEAILINTIDAVGSEGYGELAADLGQMLEFSRQMMRADVLEQPLPPLTFRGLTPQEIREQSHHPQKHYGLAHLFPQPGQGPLMAQLNFLRTQSRELELAAIDAFYGNGSTVERPDILMALNRFSSMVYLMMLQMASGRYKVGN
ncbi:MAG: hypothetical protein ACYDG6_00970 [Thermincolia bacterium]